MQFWVNKMKTNKQTNQPHWAVWSVKYPYFQYVIFLNNIIICYVLKGTLITWLLNKGIHVIDRWYLKESSPYFIFCLTFRDFGNTEKSIYLLLIYGTFYSSKVFCFSKRE